MEDVTTHVEDILCFNKFHFVKLCSAAADLSLSGNVINLFLPRRHQDTKKNLSPCFLFHKSYCFFTHLNLILNWVY